jgi:hypothetical protein
MPLGRTDEGRSALLQRFDIFLRRRVIVHAAIHRGRDQQRRAHRQRGDRQQTIRLAMRKLGDSIGRARCDDEQIGGVSQPDVKHVRFISPEIFVGIGAPSCDRLKGERCHKFFRRARQDHIHLRASLCQLGGQVCGFIGRDGPGHPEHDAFVGKDGHIRGLYFAKN